MEKDIIIAMLDKCDIYYDDLLISSEDIIKRYMQFYSSCFNSSEKITGFAFHTGSMCFDIASVVALLLTCFNYNLASNDEILRSLEIGDMVLFRGERYRWNGIQKGTPGGQNSEAEYIRLTQDAKGKNGASTSYLPFERNKHKVKPYYGQSEVTDGRGIRRTQNNRYDFLSYILGIEESEVPSSLSVSVVVLADKSEFIDICQHINIRYKKEKSIQITDIVPVSYYTGNGEEAQIGKNPSKAEAVIKAVSKVSAARDLVLDKRGNKVIGLLALNCSTIAANASDIKDLLRRKSLKFAILTLPYNTESCNLVMEQYEEASVFACTKETMADISLEAKSSNKLTNELNKQIRSIVEREMEVIDVIGCWSWSEYRNLKKDIFAIRQSNWDENEKEEFVLSALALLNLFTAAFFSMENLENAIRNKKINAAVISPLDRIHSMETISSRSLSMKPVCERVILQLLSMYEQLREYSPKEKQLYDTIINNKEKRIVLIVPKAYYADLFEMYIRPLFPEVNISCSTANRFDAKEHYDLILVASDVTGKRFDPLQCYASAKLCILLYDCEGHLFKYRKRQNAKSERQLNARIKGLKGADYDRAVNLSDDEMTEEDLGDTVRDFANLDEYVDSLGMFDIRRLVTYAPASGYYTGVAEVNRVGTFTTGEQILFSKFYSAVVYDRLAQKVVETAPEKLVPGDVLVFTKRDDYTRNIVDMIFDQLLSNNKLSASVQNAAEKASYWKQVLREYKQAKGLSFRGLTHELQKYGSSLQEVTIRQWLDEESHIVGPRNENSMVSIAKTTQDEALLADPKGYFEACRIVRHYRREILGLIAKAISDKLSNKVPEPGSVFEVVYDHVENLSETMELENVYELDEAASISSGLVNRPIVETEVLL